MESGRYVLYATALMGLAASARYAIDPPKSAVTAPSMAVVASDPAAAGYAVLFARRYLTWNAARPDIEQNATQAFTGSALEPSAGLVLPLSGEQTVDWAEVVQERMPEAGVRIYTVAAQTDRAGLVYLTVPVAHPRGGPLALAGYPAFVGAPESDAAAVPKTRALDDPALETVVVRALRNYLSGEATNLAADLVPGARVSSPPNALTLLTVQTVGWAPAGQAVALTVTAQDAEGAQYTLTYELDVAAVHGRWEVAAVQTNPDA